MKDIQNQSNEKGIYINSIQTTVCKETKLMGIKPLLPWPKKKREYHTAIHEHIYNKFIHLVTSEWPSSKPKKPFFNSITIHSEYSNCLF